jgi:hypothetical protein
VHDAADTANLLAGENRRPLEQILMTSANLHPALGGEVEDALGLGLVQCERLLDVHVRAGLDQPARDRRVGVRRRHDVDHVGPSVAQECVDVADDDGVGRHEALELVGIRERIGNTDHCGARHLLDRRQMMQTHLAAADEADPQQRP